MVGGTEREGETAGVRGIKASKKSGMRRYSLQREPRNSAHKTVMINGKAVRFAEVDEEH